MTESPKPRWKLVEEDDLSLDLATRIAQFMEQFGGGEDLRRGHSADYYHWKLGRSPLGKGFVSVAMSGDTIAGLATVTRKTLWWRGQSVQAAEIGDTFVGIDFRRQGIFTALVVATRDRAFSKGIDIIYGTPNDQSRPGYEKKLEFKTHPAITSRLWLFPVRPGASLKAAGSRKLSEGAPILDGVVRRLFVGLPTGVSAVHVPLGFDERYDGLQERLKGRYTHFLDRSARWLDYRYVDNPDRRRYGLIECRTRGRLDGALVYKQTLEKGLPTLFVADLFAASDGAERALWNEAVRQAARLGCAFVATWAVDGPRAIARRAPWVPQARKDVPVIVSKAGRGTELLEDGGDWLFSIACSDNL